MNEIETLIAEPLAQFRKTYSQLIASPVTLVNEVAEYLNKTPGKQLRPMLMMLSDAATGNHNPRIAQLATAIELLHNATLIHDDVVDESDFRRGRPTVNSRWGNKIAVLCGDYYLAQVMMILNQYGDKEVVLVVNQATIDLSEGELIQQMHSLHQDYSESHYMETIYKKTAALIATSAELGALGTPYRSLMREVGRLYGLAFQMHDDLLDLQDPAETGKPSGNDIREKKMTLPMLCHLHKLSDADRNDLLQTLSHETLTDDEVNTIKAAILNSGAINTAYNMMAKQTDLAIARCLQMPDSPYRQAFISLCEKLKQ